MTYEERQAEILRLKRDHAAALSVGMIGEGTISGFQVAKMSKRARSAWEARVSECFEVRAQIRLLERTDEQIAADAKAEQDRERTARIAAARHTIKMSLDFGRSPKTGKLRPSFLPQIEKARAELAELGASETEET